MENLLTPKNIIKSIASLIVIYLIQKLSYSPNLKKI